VIENAKVGEGKDPWVVSRWVLKEATRIALADYGCHLQPWAASTYVRTLMF